jgi:hypothetical protein
MVKICEDSPSFFWLLDVYRLIIPIHKARRFWWEVTEMQGLVSRLLEKLEQLDFWLFHDLTTPFPSGIRILQKRGFNQPAISWSSQVAHSNFRRRPPWLPFNLSSHSAFPIPTTFLFRSRSLLCVWSLAFWYFSWPSVNHSNMCQRKCQTSEWNGNNEAGKHVLCLQWFYPLNNKKVFFRSHMSCFWWYQVHHRQMGVSINGGTPIAGWFIRENPSLTWMRTGGSPMPQETSICFMDKSCDKCPFLMDIYPPF